MLIPVADAMDATPTRPGDDGDSPPPPLPTDEPRLSELAPGIVIGAYTIIGMLARGGMAEIYLALGKMADGQETPVVLKRVLSSLPTHDDPTTMFADEAALSARLHHPNLVETLDLVDSDVGMLIVLEHLHGADCLEILHTCARLRRRVPWDAIVQTMLCVCEGLHYAHELTDESGASMRVIHRDVSPQNVFLTFDGNVKLLDFGLAKSVFQASVTRDGVAKGKLSYMSPEQVMTKALDHRTDIWSLGIVLYELSLGVKLFDVGRGELNVVRDIMEARVPRPRDIDPGYPAALEAIVLRALAKRPEDRFPTAYAFARDLAAAAAEAGIVPSPEAVTRFLNELYPDRIVGRTAPGPELLPSAIADPPPEKPVEKAAENPTVTPTRRITRQTSPVMPIVQLERERDARRRKILIGFAVAAVVALIAGAIVAFAR
mgnify:CR=1 FL=1